MVKVVFMAQKYISELLATAQKPLLSYEFFPPKDEAGMATLERAATDLRSTHPDFVTVTYGAGGSTQERTLAVCECLKQLGYDPVMHHLTCVGASRAEIGTLVDRLYETGLRNIMALRGDPPRGESHFRRHPDGFAYAVDLVRFLKKRYPDLCCGVAGYPETHTEALSPESDILYLKDKLEAGGAFVTTQLFYDNAVFYRFVQTCRDWGIRAPIVPGLLPPISLSQLRRMTSMCKASLPETLVRQMTAAGDDAAKAEAVGIAWTVQQIRDLIAHEVPGIHLYILNRSKAALAPALKECFGR
jgi:methylenetetrahydrofolate reductase (NADPH)